MRCRSCHAVYARPAMLPLGNPYEDHSSDVYFRAHDPTAKVVAGTQLVKRAGELLGKKGRMLEVGCGRGETLRIASREGWVARGVEMTPSFLQDADGDVEIEVARAEDASSFGESWDVILFAAILEHLYEPSVVLSRAWRALVPGGLIFIDVPNECSLFTRIGNLYMRFRGRNWATNLSPTFPPYHVVGFCPRSLRGLLASHRFDVVALRTHRWLNECPADSGLLATLERFAIDCVLSAGVYLRMGAGITCWARRPVER